LYQAKWAAPRTGPDCFYAYPLRLPGVTEFNVDWTSAPDRYAISEAARPAAAWLRCFQFFAYKATKYHVLARSWPEGQSLSDSYRVVCDVCPCEVGWYCLFAFFAFDGPVAGANLYTLQSSSSVGGLPRLRVGMVPSEREGEWESTAASGTGALAVWQSRSTCRLSIRRASGARACFFGVLV